ncbi:MAG: sugar phosphate isomerase/epimerase family protein [Rhodothermales bacterium]
MKLGINTFLFCSPLANEHLGLLSKFADWGFDCAEIAVEDPALVDGASVATAFQESGLSHLITCGAYGPGRDLRGSQKEQQAALDYTRQVMDMMPAYGSILFCGPLYSAVGRAVGYSADEKARHWDLVAGNLSVLCEHAQSLDITIGMEVLNRFETDFMNTAAQAVEMVETVNHPALKIHLDSFHMNIEEQSFSGAVHTAGKHLAHFHASANHRGTPGQDTIPWTEIHNALVEIKYAGDIVIESFSTSVESIARACCIWRDPGDAESIAKDGLRFLRSL